WGEQVIRGSCLRSGNPRRKILTPIGKLHGTQLRGCVRALQFRAPLGVAGSRNANGVFDAHSCRGRPCTPVFLRPVYVSAPNLYRQGVASRTAFYAHSSPTREKFGIEYVTLKGAALGERGPGLVYFAYVGGRKDNSSIG